MRYPAAFLTAMALPASAVAHVGPHPGMSQKNGLSKTQAPRPCQSTYHWSIVLISTSSRCIEQNVDMIW